MQMEIPDDRMTPKIDRRTCEEPVSMLSCSSPEYREGTRDCVLQQFGGGV